MKNALLIAAMLLLTWTISFSQQRNNKEVNNNVLTNYNVNIRNASGINTPSMEFSPMFYQRGIVFVSSRQKHGPVDEKLGETFYDIYYSDIDPNGMLLKPTGFSLEINSQYHEGPVAFNRKQDRIYFTRSNQSAPGITKADEKGKVWLKIYEARRGEFDWENVRELPFNSNNYSCMHPTLSPDGTKIFFASNMPGGYGGRDIYMSEKQGESWSKPVNLGPEVNTEKDEAFPFFHESGVLFFASEGHDGYGGFDLFMIDLSTREWGQVTNLGKPFNTTQDDFGLIINPQGRRGYFTSNREGGAGKDDIYFFEIPNGLQGLDIKPKVGILVTVYDAGTSRPMTDAVVRVFEQSGSGLVDNEALYDVELVPSADNPSDLVFKMKRKKEEEMNVPKQLTNRIGETMLQLEENKDYLILVTKPGFVAKEINYSVGSGGIPRPIEVLLDQNNCLGLNGVALSSNSRRPISGARVRIVNSCTGKEDIVTTNIEGRFEFCLEMGCDYNIVSEKTGYTKGFSEISTVKIRGSRSVNIEIAMTPTSVETFDEPLRKGTVIILENIYYDFDKSAIRAGEDRDLEALAAMMKQYPSMEIELIAHTDSRGDNAYNLALSLRRAESAKDFLVSRNVEPKRIRAFGYGESQLRNHCSDGVECSEEDHQRNRRTEVIVTKINEPVPFDFQEKGGRPDKKN